MWQDLGKGSRGSRKSWSRERRGRGEGGCLCQAPVSSWVCMHAMTHQESFFQGQAFTFPALKACWKITHTFSMKSLTITGKQTQRQLVGSVTPRPFNLSASHWENPWKEGKDSAFFFKKKKKEGRMRRKKAPEQGEIIRLKAAAAVATSSERQARALAHLDEWKGAYEQRVAREVLLGEYDFLCRRRCQTLSDF